MNTSLANRNIAGVPPAVPQCAAELTVVMYHYIRDLPRSRFPRIKGLLLGDFRAQVAGLRQRFEMATLDSALAYLAGEYRPTRDLCLLTFDDGLREHYDQVTPLLAEFRVQGLFFVITGCLEEHAVAAVHKNHFLMAALDFPEYRRAFVSRLAEVTSRSAAAVDSETSRQTYRWDEPEVAEFKYLVNFLVDDATKERVFADLFRKYLGDEQSFARELYVSWEEARQMQAAGMLLGGHTHRHQALATMPNEAVAADLARNWSLLQDRLHPQRCWPFSYPYGKPGTSFHAGTQDAVRAAGFDCAFSTEVGANRAGQERFAIRRIDTKDAV